MTSAATAATAAVPTGTGEDRPAPPPPVAGPAALGRRALAEAVGTGALVVAVVGSGIAAERLSPGAPGLQLGYNAVVTAAALAVLIVVLGPLSGGHFNPAVTMVEWFRDRRRRGAAATAVGYLAAQFAGGAAGAVLANQMFGLPAVAVSTADRGGVGSWLGEVVATAGLLLVIGALHRTGRVGAVPLAVGAWIGAAMWFTASTSFANPAVTAGRMLTDSLTGIAPASAPGFVAAQLAGAALGAGLVALLWPRERR